MARYLTGMIMDMGKPEKTGIPTHIYVGPRAAVMAEVGTPDYYEGKYLVQPYSAAEDFFPDVHIRTRKDLKDQVSWWKRSVPGIKVVWLG